MPRALLINNSFASQNGSFQTVAHGGTGSETVEARRAFLVHIPGELNLLAGRITATGTARSIKSRLNEGDGNQEIFFTDSTEETAEQIPGGTDPLADGDTFNTQTVSSGSPIYRWAKMVFRATSGHACFYANQLVTLAADGTVYCPIVSRGSNATEVHNQATIRVPGTMRDFFVYISANTRTTTTTFRNRINEGNGSCSIAVGSTLTGIFEDTDAQDPLVSDDRVNHSVTLAAGSGSITWETFGCAIAATSGAASDVFAIEALFGGTSKGFSGTSFLYIGGLLTLTVEARTRIRAGFDIRLQNARVRLSANSFDGATTIAVRKNGADGNGSIGIGATLTGVFEADPLLSDVFGPSDEISVGISDAATSGTITISEFAITALDYLLETVIGAAGQSTASFAGVAVTETALAAAPAAAASFTGAANIAAALTASPALTTAIVGSSEAAPMTAAAVLTVSLVGGATNGQPLSISAALTVALVGSGVLGGAMSSGAVLATSLIGTSIALASGALGIAAAATASFTGASIAAGSLAASPALTASWIGAGISQASFAASAALSASFDGSYTVPMAMAAQASLAVAFSSSVLVGAAMTAEASSTCAWIARIGTKLDRASFRGRS